MSDLIAYELRADYAGSTTQVREDGSSATVPVFAGGIVAAGARDLDLRAELDHAPAKGYVVVYSFDVGAVAALDEYPALKRTTVPKGAKPRNPFVDRSVDDLRRELSAVNAPQSGGKEELADRLLATVLGDKAPKPPEPDGPPSANPQQPAEPTPAAGVEGRG